MSEDIVNETEENAKKFLKIFRKKNCRKDESQIMWSLLTPEVIRTMACAPQKYVSIHRIPIHLPYSRKLDFFYNAYSIHDQLPRLELLKLWCEGMLHPYFDLSSSEKEAFMQKEKLYFLTDLKPVQEIICEKELKGWELLRYTCGEGRRWKTLSLQPVLKDAILADDVPSFAIFKDMSGQHGSFSFLRMILKQGAYHILQFILENHEIGEDTVTFPELCVLIVTQFEEAESIAFLNILEKCRPGCLKEFRDPFGRNLLWYTIYNKKTVWFHPKNQLIPYLLKQGCDPENCNQLGLSWRFVCRNMPQDTKLALMHHYDSFVKFEFPSYVFDRIPETENREALKIVEQWTETAVLKKNIPFTKLKKAIRSRHRAPLFLNTRNALENSLLETYWNYPYFPEATLPKTWQEHLLEKGTFHALPRLMRSVDIAVMASYHHPLTGAVPNGSYGTGLASIPLKDGKATSCKSMETEALAILKTGLLLYHPMVLDYYCRQSYPGYRILRHLLRKSCGAPYFFRAKFLPLIWQDNLPEFALLYNMTNSECPPGMLDDILRNNAVSIRDWLLDESDKFREEYSLSELLFFAVSNLKDNQAVDLIDAIEARWPESVSESFDCFRSNLLWYGLFNPEINHEKYKNSKVVKRLQEAGCSLVEPNSFGITPNDICYAGQNKKIEQLLKWEINEK